MNSSVVVPGHEPQIYCDDVGTVRLYRHGPIVTSWKVLHELPGRMRLRHPALYRRKDVCQAIDRELMSVLGSITTKRIRCRPRCW